MGRVATLEDEGLFPPDPEVRDIEPPEFDQIEGLSVRMTHTMNHYQPMLCVWHDGPFCKGLSSP